MCISWTNKGFNVTNMYSATMKRPSLSYLVPPGNLLKAFLKMDHGHMFSFISASPLRQYRKVNKQIFWNQCLKIQLNIANFTKYNVCFNVISLFFYI